MRYKYSGVPNNSILPIQVLDLKNYAIYGSRTLSDFGPYAVLQDQNDAISEHAIFDQQMESVLIRHEVI